MKGAVPSIYDYGIIGNECTGALISRDGSIDWACLPRFDSPSIFGRILDPRAGGWHQVVPAEPYLSHQQYHPGTNVLTTFFEIRRQVSVILTDLMPIGPAGSPLGKEPRILRRMAARGAACPVRLAANPQFDYGRRPARWRLEGGLAIADAGTDQLSFTSPWPWSLENGMAVSGGTVEPNRPLFAQVRQGGPPGSDPSPESLLALTDAYWKAWVSPPDAPLRRVAARWQPWVERSELVLKLLCYADSGVFVAAPTTSLPEWPGSTRNWDYRYVWIRDSAFTAQIFLMLGHYEEARGYVRWAFDRASHLRESEDLRPLYTVDGTSPPPEEELPHLEGFRGSRPVRIGNAASDQRQLDIYGEILDCAQLLAQVDPAFVRDRWEIVDLLAQRTMELWSQPDSGIWEFRTPPAHYVHSKLMCWVALDRAAKIAKLLGKTQSVDRWARVAEEIQTTILTRGYDAQRGTFVQAFERPLLDASALRIALDGWLPPDDPRVLGTIAAIEQRLAHGPFVHRYEGEDGIAGPEGYFLICSFWLVEALAKSGQVDRALENWNALLHVAGPLLLFSEQYDPTSKQPLGNYPQAFTHIGMLRAAFALGLMTPEH